MTFRTPLLLTAIAAAAITLPGLAQTATAQTANTITLTVTGINSTDGQLIVCLFDAKRDFPECEAGDGTARRVFRITGATTRLIVPLPANLPASGDYAVTVFHDKNSNGRLNTNFIGMPTEGVGVSGNPGGMPRYSRSQVTLTNGSAISITMRYLFD